MNIIVLAFVIWLAGICGISAQTAATPYSYEQQLDLNNAEFEEIARLPISVELAERLYDRIQYAGPFANLFELREVEGLTQEILLVIKPLVRIEPYEEKSERETRIEDLYFQLDRWSGDEGTSQALVDAWIVQALEPVNVNRLRFDELMNLQGVSPVDAAAIINYRADIGEISSLRSLRTVPYLSYFGYRNARNFVSFSDPQESRREFHGNLLFRTTNTPFQTEEGDITENTNVLFDNNALFNNNQNDYPDFYTRFIGTYGNDIHIGLSHWHSLSEPLLTEDLGIIDVPTPKMYVGVEGKKLGPLEMRKLYVGNFALAFGEGVVMENNDYFSPRKSGFGFRKRFLGLSGDNSRTRQYMFTGAATELGLGNAHLFLWGAFDERDAILNTQPVTYRDSEGNEETVNPVNQFIVLDQRFEYAPRDSVRRRVFGLPWRNTVKELMMGFHGAYDLLPTTQLGVTYYESAYDRPLSPNVEEIVGGDNLGLLTLADNEILNAYGGSVSNGENAFWGAAKSFRRVYGMNLRSVHENVALQAEYAELDKRDGVSMFGLSGDNPWAFVGSAYVQYNSFNMLGLYRNYQLGFDNPYQRSFSNYSRYKRTIYEDYFYLQDPFYGQLYTNNPQPQAEEGFYFSTRYQINRKFTTIVEYDNWKRKADDVTQYRLRGTLQFRPIFPVVVDLRQKWQGREALNDNTLEYFENSEFRGQLRFRLSRFDQLSLLYMDSNVRFRPRPRFSYPVQTGADGEFDNYGGTSLLPGTALGGTYAHNFNKYLKVSGSMMYYEGFFWNFEDTQFIVSDGGSGAIRWWLSFYSRISNRASMRLKYTQNRQTASTFVQTRDANNEVRGPIDNGRYYQGSYVQPTQAYFFLEFNYNL